MTNQEQQHGCWKLRGREREGRVCVCERERERERERTYMYTCTKELTHTNPLTTYRNLLPHQKPSFCTSGWRKWSLLLGTQQGAW